MNGLVYVSIKFCESRLHKIINSEFPFLSPHIINIITDINVNINNNGILIDNWQEIYSEFSSLFSMGKYISSNEFVEKYIDNDLKYFNFIKNIKHNLFLVRDFSFGLNIIENDKLSILPILIDREILKLNSIITFIRKLNTKIYNFKVCDSECYIELFNSLIKYLEKYKKTNIELFF